MWSLQNRAFDGHLPVVTVHDVCLQYIRLRGVVRLLVSVEQLEKNCAYRKEGFIDPFPAATETLGARAPSNSNKRHTVRRPTVRSIARASSVG